MVYSVLHWTISVSCLEQSTSWPWLGHLFRHITLGETNFIRYFGITELHKLKVKSIVFIMSNPIS